MAEDNDSDELSTVNTNARVELEQRQDGLAEGEQMVILSGIQNTRDLLVMVNRIIEKYGSVSGVNKISGDVVIVYCDRY